MSNDLIDLISDQFQRQSESLKAICGVLSSLNRSLLVLQNTNIKQYREIDAKFKLIAKFLHPRLLDDESSLTDCNNKTCPICSED